jgi:hypothetical protein
MADDRDYLEISCHQDRYAEVQGIADLEILMRPLRGEDPTIVTFPALAAAAAQDAVRALGCTITVVKTAAQYQEHLARAYSRDDEPPDAPA